MGTITKIKLSESTDGKPISIGNLANTTRSTIHTTVNTAIDEVWLWASNAAGSAIILTVEHGEAGAGGEYRQSITNGNGLNLICQGLTLSGSTNSITAFAASVSGINIHGFVNRIDQTS